MGTIPVGFVLPDRVAPKLLVEAKERTYQGVFHRVGGVDDKFPGSPVCDKSKSPTRTTSLPLERAQAVHPGDIPASMIFALQPATKIRIYTCCFDARDESKGHCRERSGWLGVLFEVT
ncbi:hypothetical protein GQ600_14964 [Phytophthora cactorum]|nr:hypothetical protein GQ600_14964 [Phytophthora cactorum]